MVGSFSDSINATIEAIVITPFDQPNKNRFFLYYHLFDRDAHAALYHEYKGLFFDVMIIGRTLQDELKYDDLYSCLTENNFDSKEYPTCPLPGKNTRINYI